MQGLDSVLFQLPNWRLKPIVMMLEWHSYSAVVKPADFAVAVKIESQSPVVAVVEFAKQNSIGFAPAVVVLEVWIEGSNCVANLIAAEECFVPRNSTVAVASEVLVKIGHYGEAERRHLPGCAKSLPVVHSNHSLCMDLQEWLGYSGLMREAD